MTESDRDRKIEWMHERKSRDCREWAKVREREKECKKERERGDLRKVRESQK